MSSQDKGHGHSPQLLQMRCSLATVPTQHTQTNQNGSIKEPNQGEEDTDHKTEQEIMDTPWEMHG